LIEQTRKNKEIEWSARRKKETPLPGTSGRRLGVRFFVRKKSRGKHHIGKGMSPEEASFEGKKDTLACLQDNRQAEGALLQEFLPHGGSGNRMRGIVLLEKRD